MEIIETARANLTQAIHTYWEKAARENRVIKKFKPAAILLFKEENGDQADPYILVCRNEPPRYTQGYQVLQYEIVPAWTLYLSRAAALLQLLETGVQLNDYQRRDQASGWNGGTVPQAD